MAGKLAASKKSAERRWPSRCWSWVSMLAVSNADVQPGGSRKGAHASQLPRYPDKGPRSAIGMECRLDAKNAQKEGFQSETASVYGRIT
jgi:hypothetical protein